MCGRFALDAPPKLIQEYFDAMSTVDIEPNYNVSPSQHIAAVRQTDKKELVIMQWGFVPTWNYEPKPKLAPINAKVETVLHNRYFSRAIRQKRCIVPMSGFFEWQVTGSGKQPYYFSSPNETIFGVAGIWSERIINNIKEYRVAILVQEPNETVKEIHNRMPLIINHNYLDNWLNDKPEETLNVIVEQNKERLLQKWPVSMQVNKPSFNTPDCIKPIEL